jgi:hypothetical protein
MTKQIERFKSDEEMTAADWIEHGRTGKRPERDEYREARRKALEGAGLEHGDPGAKTLDEMTPDDHFDHIRRNR